LRADLAGATVRILVDPLLAVVFPSSCPSCDSPLAHPSAGPLCGACWATLDRGTLLARCRCGSPLVAGGRAACGRCRRGLTPLSSSLSLGGYDGPLRAVIHELKYHGRRRVAARLAERLAAAPIASALLTRETVLVPVPLHPRRRRERGFNQAELLALELGRRLALPVRAACLVRRLDTPSQTGLTAAQRRKNVKDAFAVVRRAQVAGRVVVLVDDVVTTGATLRACARVLLAAGASEVRTVSAARVY
jgi:ComF family protein